MTRKILCSPQTRVTPGRVVVWFAAVSILSLGLAGCGEEDLGAYPAPKSAPYVEPGLFSGLGPAASANPAASKPVGITWDVPEQWAEAPSTSSFLLAVFEAKGDLGDARITVSSLVNDGGGVLENINRWRGQVGLGPIERYQQQPMAQLTVAGQVAGLIDLSAPEGAGASLDRLMVVFIPRPDQGLTWYFKMSGSSATLEAQKQAFISFVESVGFGEQPAGRSETDGDGDGVVPSE